MSKLGFVVLLLVHILVFKVQAMTHESEAPSPFPLEHITQSGVELHDHSTDKIEDHKVSAEAPNIRRLGEHHSTEKSVAGGGVIIGGFVTAIFAAIFCYIRVTRKRDTGY
jgi:hypothetical protein